MRNSIVDSQMCLTLIVLIALLDYLAHLDYLDYLDCLTEELTENLKSRDASASKNISSCWKKSFPLNLFCFCVVKNIPILRRALHHSLSQSTWLVQHTLHITLRFCFFSVSFWVKAYSAYGDGENGQFSPSWGNWPICDISSSDLHIILQGVPK